MLTIPKELHDHLIPGIFFTLFGALVTFIVTKLTNKTAKLRYSSTADRIATAADDVIFGSVRITWGDGQEVRNLYLVTLEVENTSSRDFENVELKVYCAPETRLMGERSSVVDSPYGVLWSPGFRGLMALAEDGIPTQHQLETYSHTREYLVPVFNRGQLIHFSYLCTRPNDDVTPAVFLSTQLKGARLFLQNRKSFIHGVPTQIALTHGLVIAFLTVSICGYFLHNVPVASIICIFVGLFAQSFGAVEYMVFKRLWRLLTM